VRKVSMFLQWFHANVLSTVLICLCLMQTNRRFVFTSGIMVSISNYFESYALLNSICYLERFVYYQSAYFSHSAKVYNVVPGDFTHTGKLDLLVMGHDGTSGLLDMKLYMGMGTDGFGTHTVGYIHLLCSPGHRYQQPAHPPVFLTFSAYTSGSGWRHED
jgi:hypothetical protein